MKNNDKLKFVVRSNRRSLIVADIRSAVDACLEDLETPSKNSMDKMRLLIDGRLVLEPHDDMMLYNSELDKLPYDHDKIKYCCLFACEEV